MLYIEQASAGSGKTYTLAFTYIRDLMGVREDGANGYRLRSVDEMRDALGRILAITFTNKATNEMKARIVDKLAKLANTRPDCAGIKVDYLEKLADEFHVDQRRIILQAKLALEVLLHNYADFNVSTIDSFFQTVVRSFTSEIDELAANYQIELDDKMVAKRSVDATLSQVKETVGGTKETSDISAWLQLYIDRKRLNGENWNPFMPSQENIYGGSPSTLRDELKLFFALTDRESFKKNEKKLTEYFHKYGNRFLDLYKAVLKARNNRLNGCATKCTDLINMLVSSGCYRQLQAVSARGIPGCLNSIMAKKPGNTPPAVKWSKTAEDFINGGKLFTAKAIKTGVSDDVRHLEPVVRELFLAVKEWEDCYRRWNESTSNLHLLGLLEALSQNRRRFLSDNNLLQLSSTNQFLHRIICEEDAPFIYERIGAYIDNYLIDEFQDTSRMQWVNLKPLLRESLGRGCDNLIIGDVKQSIYRFRNAEPQLIAHDVPCDPDLEIFPGANGLDVVQSTNWRSCRHVVQFNNTLFRLLATKMPLQMYTGTNLPELYRTVVQKVKKMDEPGYVRVEFGGKQEDNAASIPVLIADMLLRGYRQNEIAILVDKKSDSTAVLNAINKYNASLPQETACINVISDEALTVSSSIAVQIIVSLLELIQYPPGSTKRKEDVRAFLSNYHYMKMLNPELSLHEAMMRHKHGDVAVDGITGLLKHLASLTLPSLVEALENRFLSEEVRNQQAPYLAAFEDLVLDYCDKHPADIASFLRWWNDGKDSFSISSPEGVDAVTLMTIHKSKGLEFNCVIVPAATWSFTPKSSEVLWVKPSLPETVVLNDVPLPPVIPVTLGNVTEESPYSEARNEIYTNTLVDKLNETYVAFTRAKKEIYIFCGTPRSNNLAGILKQILPMMADYIATDSNYLQIQEWRMDPDGIVYEYGIPTHSSAKPLPETEHLKWPVNMNRSALLCNLDKDGNSLEVQSTFESDETLAGIALHEAMRRVATPDRLYSALLGSVAKGAITYEEADKWMHVIAPQMERKPISDWFRRGLKILAERTIFTPLDNSMHIPDRVVIDPPTGDAVVIDYKFGDTEQPEYKKQVREYMHLMKQTKMCHSVKGYIWYVALSKVIPCEE